MGTLDTKLLIADALVQLCEEQPLKKVSISDIVERTGKNRKTFYYHFEDRMLSLFGSSDTIWDSSFNTDSPRTSWFTRRTKTLLFRASRSTSRRNRACARLTIRNSSTPLPLC